MAKQSAQSDADRRVHWISPLAIETIAADTAISSAYVAIKPIADVEVYFNGVSGTTFTAYAGEIFPLPKTKTSALAAETKCLVY